ncbi:MAG: RNA-binding S4 domain-containing protein [Vicinamibacterales bacterium]
MSQFLRLDVWLDVACLFKTRSEAQRACSGGKVDVNGATAKPHRNIKPGDAIVISRPFGRKQTLTVRDLTERHVTKAQARSLYEDTTPLPSREEIELRRLERQWRASSRPVHTPNKRERRALRKLKERE